MNSKKVTMISCLVMLAVTATIAEEAIPKLYEEIGCKAKDTSNTTR